VVLDDLGFNIFLSINCISEDLSPLGKDFFRAMSVPQDYFKISSDDFGNELFESIVLAKDLFHQTIDIKIKYTERPPKEEYGLNVQVTYTTVAVEPEPEPEPEPPVEPTLPPAMNRILVSSTDYHMEDDIKIVPIRYVEQPSATEVQNAQEMGEIFGDVSNVSATSAEWLSLAAALAGQDPSGTFLRFAQGTKLITRHRMISVNHGLLLRTYLKEANEKFDKPSELSEAEILANTNGNKFKFTKFKAPLNIFETRTIQIALYLFCWLLKLYTLFIIHTVNKTMKTTKFQCYFVLYQQKIHFIFFQMVVLDIWYTGLRTVFHTNSDYKIGVKLISMLCVTLSFFDLIEIWHKSSNYVIKQAQI
jgi:hypothetical protein